jgi:hypothetical protein
LVTYVYRPNVPFGQFSSNELTACFNDYLLEILCKNELSKDNVYIFGYFNIDLLKLENHKPTSDYMELIFSAGYLQIVTKPTRCIHGSSTLIDHVLTNSNQTLYDCNIILSRISDHFPIICMLDTTKIKPKNPIIQYRNFSENNINRFKAALRNISWNPILEETNAQTAYSQFPSDFFTLFDMHFPVKTKRFNRNLHKKEKWMSAGLLVSRLHKIKLCKLSIRIPSTVNIENYKRYRNLYNVVLKGYSHEILMVFL